MTDCCELATDEQIDFDAKIEQALQRADNSTSLGRPNRPIPGQRQEPIQRDVNNGEHKDRYGEHDTESDEPPDGGGGVIVNNDFVGLGVDTIDYIRSRSNNVSIGTIICVMVTFFLTELDFMVVPVYYLSTFFNDMALLRASSRYATPILHKPTIGDIVLADPDGDGNYRRAITLENDWLVMIETMELVPYNSDYVKAAPQFEGSMTFRALSCRLADGNANGQDRLKAGDIIRLRMGPMEGVQHLVSLVRQD